MWKRGQKVDINNEINPSQIHVRKFRKFNKNRKSVRKTLRKDKSTKSLLEAKKIANNLKDCKAFSRNAKNNGSCYYYSYIPLICNSDLFVKKCDDWVLKNQKKGHGMIAIHKDNLNFSEDIYYFPEHLFTKKFMKHRITDEVDFVAFCTIDDILSYVPQKNIDRDILIKILNKKLDKNKIKSNLIWSYYRLNSDEELFKYLKDNKDKYSDYFFPCVGYYSESHSDIQIGITGSLEKEDIVYNQKTNNYDQSFMNCVKREIKEEIGLQVVEDEMIHNISSQVFIFHKGKDIIEKYMSNLFYYCNVSNI